MCPNMTLSIFVKGKVDLSLPKRYFQYPKIDLFTSKKYPSNDQGNIGNVLRSNRTKIYPLIPIHPLNPLILKNL
jgi:hypothetical protein